MRENLPPLVDRHRFRPQPHETTAFIIYALILYIAPMTSLAALHATQNNMLLFAAVPLIFLSASGLMLLATIGHEGWHLNLSKNRTLSCVLGIFFSSAMPLFMVTGYFTFHWQHHRHTNSQHDPDYLHFRRYRSAIGRLLFARVSIALHYLRLTLALASGHHRKHGLPFGSVQVRRLAFLNIICQIAWLLTYTLACVYFPFVCVPLFATLALAMMLSSLNPYQEHAFVPSALAALQANKYRSARSRSSLWVTLLHGGSNFHVEHHLYPNIPCWHLPRVHRHLRSAGWYNDKTELLDTGFFRSYRYALRAYVYGD